MPWLDTWKDIVICELRDWVFDLENWIFPYGLVILCNILFTKIINLFVLKDIPGLENYCVVYYYAIMHYFGILHVTSLIITEISVVLVNVS